MSQCTCGRTTRPPHCDGSHWLSDEEFVARSKSLEWLKKPIQSITDTLEDKINNENFQKKLN